MKVSKLCACPQSVLWTNSRKTGLQHECLSEERDMLPKSRETVNFNFRINLAFCFNLHLSFSLAISHVRVLLLPTPVYQSHSRIYPITCRWLIVFIFKRFVGVDGAAYNRPYHGFFSHT